MSQRTLWEEGRKPARPVVSIAVAAALAVAIGNVLISGEVALLFDVAFVAICVAAALAVRPRDLFIVGVLPPLLMLGTFFALALLSRGWLAEPGDGVIQAVVSGLAHHAGTLVTGYAVTLVTLALRQMAVRGRLPAQAGRRGG